MKEPSPGPRLKESTLVLFINLHTSIALLFASLDKIFPGVPSLWNRSYQCHPQSSTNDPAEYTLPFSFSSSQEPDTQTQRIL